MPAPSYRHRTKTEKMNPTQTNRRGGARRAWRIRLINAVCITKAERSSGQNNAVLRNRSAAPPALRPGAAAELCQKISGSFGLFQEEKKQQISMVIRIKCRAWCGAMMFTSAWPLLSSVMFTTSCDDTEELSAL